MKLLFLILTTALLCQYSWAVPLQRSKRSDLFVKDFKEMVAELKRVIPLTETVWSSTLLKIPNEEAYQAYRKDIQTYLAAVTKYKSTSGECFPKSMELIQKYFELLSFIDEDDLPKEADKVSDLFVESGGDDVYKYFKKWSELYETYNFDNEMDGLSESEIVTVQGFLTEVC